MPIYLLNRNELVEASMPGVLTDFIAFDHWQTICRMLKDSEIQAHSWVFLCECLICIIFLFPCIFLCHPCIFLLLESGIKNK